jgi:hypothetical protein
MDRDAMVRQVGRGLVAASEARRADLQRTRQ